MEVGSIENADKAEPAAALLPTAISIEQPQATDPDEIQAMPEQSASNQDAKVASDICIQLPGPSTGQLTLLT